MRFTPAGRTTDDALGFQRVHASVPDPLRAIPRSSRPPPPVSSVPPVPIECVLKRFFVSEAFEIGGENARDVLRETPRGVVRRDCHFRMSPKEGVLREWFFRREDVQYGVSQPPRRVQRLHDFLLTVFRPEHVPAPDVYEHRAVFTTSQPRGGE